MTMIMILVHRVAVVHVERPAFEVGVARVATVVLVAVFKDFQFAVSYADGCCGVLLSHSAASGTDQRASLRPDSGPCIVQ